MINGLARLGANLLQLAGAAFVVAAGFELRHWVGLALAGVLVALIGAAIEREVS